MDGLDYLEIRNLIHRYADLLDRGDADQASELFEHAAFHVGEQPEPISRPGQNQMAQVFREWIAYFPEREGTPTTRHVTTNLIIEQDGPGKARAQSYVIVTQSDDTRSMKPVMGATYHDRFEKGAAGWRFVERRLLPYGAN